jgi:hypothetical protein
VTDRHLKRDEAAIAIAEHDGFVAAGGILHRFRHSIGDLGKTTADRLRSAKTRQFRHDQAKRSRQFRRDGVKTRAVRQQRMKQKQRGPLADLRRIDCAVGEKPIHSGLSFILAGHAGPDASSGLPCAEPSS